MPKLPKRVEEAHAHDFHKSVPLKGLPHVHGYDFSRPFDFETLLSAYGTTGAQATHLWQAIELIREMRKEKEITIYLGYTSNMVSSGLRDIFRYLVQHKLVDVVVTTAGGVEEDIIKCLAPFSIGSFESPGKELRKQGINRIGNMLVPNEHYAKFEAFLTPILARMTQEQEQQEMVHTPSDLVWRLGKEINNDASIYTWAERNNIPVFCPAIIDGSIGDIIYFSSYKNPGFKLDTVGEIRKIHDITLNAKKTGLVILGAGLVKHFILNTNMLRNGADYAVYVNTAQEFDASDAGARPDEAVSWGKLLPGAKTVKVYADATIVFPLIVAGAFAR